MFNELCEANANLPNSKMLQLVITLFFCMEALFFSYSQNQEIQIVLVDLFFSVGVIPELLVGTYAYVYLFWNFANASLSSLIFLSLEKILTSYEFYYFVVFSLAFFIGIEGSKEL